MSARKPETLPAVIAVILLLIFAAGAVILLRDAPPEPSEDGALTVTTSAAASAASTTAASTTTTAAATSLTTTTTAAGTTVTETTAAPTDDDFYVQYLTETLLPKYGTAAEGIAAPEAQTGIAAAYICDFLGKGTDMLVIRLDALDGVTASVPVLMWYTLYEGKVVLADTFESKLPLTGYRIRYAAQTVYISGEYAAAAPDPTDLLCTEIAVMMQENRDMILLDLEQGGANDLPAPRWPAEAALLLEVLPDPAAETGRAYLLYDYTNLHDLHT